MRQAWINNLRDLLSEIASSALHYHVAGFEDRTDQEYQHLTLLEYKIKLMLNPRENDHQQLESLIARMTGMLSQQGSSKLDADFEACHEAVIALSREVLKREWDRIKTEFNRHDADSTWGGHPHSTTIRRKKSSPAAKPERR